MTEPAVFVPDVTKQHDVFVRVIASEVLMNAHASLNRRLFECFIEDLPKLALVPTTGLRIEVDYSFSRIDCRLRTKEMSSWITLFLICSLVTKLER